MAFPPLLLVYFPLCFPYQTSLATVEGSRGVTLEPIRASPEQKQTNPFQQIHQTTQNIRKQIKHQEHVKILTVVPETQETHIEVGEEIARAICSGKFEVTFFLSLV